MMRSAMSAGGSTPRASANCPNGNLPVAEGLRIEAEEWLKAGIEPKALELMQSYVDTPYEDRRAWIEQHGVWPNKDMATGSRP